MSDRIRKPQKSVALSAKARPISRTDAKILNTFMYMYKNADATPAGTVVTVSSAVIPNRPLSKSESALYKELYKANDSKAPISVTSDSLAVEITATATRLEILGVNVSVVDNLTNPVEAGDRLTFVDGEGTVWSFTVNVIGTADPEGLKFSSCLDIKKDGQPVEKFSKFKSVAIEPNNVAVFEGGWDRDLVFPTAVPAFGTTQIKQQSFLERIGKYELTLYKSFKAMLDDGVEPR